MAVTSVDERMEGRSGRQERDWSRVYQRTFLIETDSPYDGSGTVRASVPVSIGQSYSITNALGSVVESDKGAFVQSISVNCISRDGCQWEAVVEYGPYDPSEKPQNPLDWPLQISWGWVKFEKTVDTDQDDNSIQNSAGDFFDPPLTIDDSRPLLRIVRSEPSFDPTLAHDFKDAVNTDVFFDQDPGTWKCAAPTAELQFNKDCGTSDGYYYDVTYEFEFNPDGWTQKILDQGLRQLSSSVKSAITEKGLPITEPVPLDGSGLALASGKDPVYLEFRVYKEKAFSLLNLDPSGAPGQDL